MSERWVKLTPKDTDKYGHRILVNLARATSVWENANIGGSQIWFQAGHSDGRFSVQEPLDEIEKLLQDPADAHRT